MCWVLYTVRRPGQELAQGMAWHRWPASLRLPKVLRRGWAGKAGPPWPACRSGSLAAHCLPRLLCQLKVGADTGGGGEHARKQATALLQMGGYEFLRRLLLLLLREP